MTNLARVAATPAPTTDSSKLRRVALLALAATLAVAAGSSIATAIDAPAVIQQDALTWGPAPGLPEGAQIAVLYGDPSKAGPFTIRLKFPAGYEVPVHSHPTDEFITVLSGKGRMAFGEQADAKDAQPLVPGSFTTLPAGAWHHLWIDEDTIVELTSTGPFEVHVH